MAVVVVVAGSQDRLWQVDWQQSVYDCKTYIHTTSAAYSWWQRLAGRFCVIAARAAQCTSNSNSSKNYNNNNINFNNITITAAATHHCFRFAWCMPIWYVCVCVAFFYATTWLSLSLYLISVLCLALVKALFKKFMKVFLFCFMNSWFNFVLMAMVFKCRNYFLNMLHVQWHWWMLHMMEIVTNFTVYLLSYTVCPVLVIRPWFVHDTLILHF